MCPIFSALVQAFRQTTPGKTANISILRFLSNRYMGVTSMIHIVFIICIICIIHVIAIIHFNARLLGLFKTVFPYRNGSNWLIMDTGTAHSA